MSANAPASADDVSFGAHDRIDQKCDHFESAWKAGERPRIETYLEDAAEPERLVLLRELIALESRAPQEPRRAALGTGLSRSVPRSGCDRRSRLRSGLTAGAEPTAAAQAPSQHRPQPALRNPCPAKRLHRPRRPAGRLQHVGCKQVEFPLSDPPGTRRAHAQPAHADGRAGRGARQGSRQRPSEEPRRAKLDRRLPRGLIPHCRP